MRIGCGISIAGSNQKNLVSAQAEQVIWKVAIFGAGTTSSNGEYVWDGTTTFNGKPKYSFGLNEIFWAEILGTFKWVMYEDNVGDAYTSDDLISWVLENGDSPAPSSALSYSQDSYFDFTLIGAVPSTSNGTTLQSDPPANDFWFISETGNPSNVIGEIYLDDGLYYIYDYAEDAPTFTATSVFGQWTPVGNGVTPPTISSVFYSA